LRALDDILSEGARAIKRLLTSSPVQSRACEILLDGMQADLQSVMSSVVKRLEENEGKVCAAEGQNVDLEKYVQYLRNEVAELKKRVGDSMDACDMSLAKAVEKVEMGGDKNWQQEKNEVGVEGVENKVDEGNKDEGLETSEGNKDEETQISGEDDV